MPLLNWDEQYMVGIKKIDKQHTDIVNIINKLYELLDSNDNNTIIKLLEKLNDTVKKHFETENKLMTKHKIFNYFSHKAQHDRLERILEKNLDDAKAGTFELNKEFVLLMRDWMVNHHRFHDKKMGEELKGKGVK